MLQYLLKRLFLFIPTLIILSLVAFGLSKFAPGDPPSELGEEYGGSTQQRSKAYYEKAVFLGLDKPVFYCSFLPAAYPDTLYRVIEKTKRNNLKQLIGQYGNWSKIEAYHHALTQLESRLDYLPDSLPSDLVNNSKALINQLYVTYENRPILVKIDSIVSKLNRQEQLAQLTERETDQLQKSYQDVITRPTKSKLYIPGFSWYGIDNQYHNWISRTITGDFGISYRDGRPVAKKIWDAIKVTLLLNGLAIFFAYFISIPTGVYAASNRDGKFDKASSIIFFLLFSLPTFWLATLLLVFLTTPEYGMDIFPTLGLRNLESSAPFWARFWDLAWHLVLPVFCLTYTSLAYVARQVRGGMLEILSQDFVRTAKAKGLNRVQVLWKHAFPNALFPLITLFAAILPAAFAGSFVIEYIFNIPGMGWLTLQSIRGQDWPVVYIIFMLASILTIVGILLSDILYAVVDPRVRFKE